MRAGQRIPTPLLWLVERGSVMPAFHFLPLVPDVDNISFLRVQKMTASYTRPQAGIDWESAVESVALELADISIEDALAQDDLCNHGHPAIDHALEGILAGATTTLERATRIYRFAREEINYAFLEERIMPATETLKARAGGCVNKAILATALYRRAGIPAIYGLGFVKSIHFTSLIEKLLEEMLSIYPDIETNCSEEVDRTWQQFERLRGGSIQDGKTLHVVSCVRVNGRWFEADVTQNSRFMITVLQADKYFPFVLRLWDGTFDYGLPDRCFAGDKKRLKYLTRIRDLEPIYDFDERSGNQALRDLLTDMRERSRDIDIWLGAQASE